MMYIPEHFKIEELVSKQVYEARKLQAWSLLDPRALMMLDRARANFGVCIVNNWKTGGDRQFSGFRASNEPYYHAYSQHSFGRGFDCLFRFFNAEKIRASILKNRHNYPYITCIEDKVSWLHFDVRNLPPGQEGKILIVHKEGGGEYV